MSIQQNFPSTRNLRGYAIDPTLSLTIDTVEVNNTVYEVDWEDDLQPGPIGEYIEVIDYDPTTGKFYQPVDLNHPAVLASDGITPSESNPQFHQQMVYAVAMLTIRNFERALGRKIMWSPREIKGEDEKQIEEAKVPSTLGGLEALGPEETIPYKGSYTIEPYEQKKQAAPTRQPQTLGVVETTESAPPQETDRYVQRLRLYPHALREANAYYSPQKKAILFGYFAASPSEVDQLMPGSLVFTCLSHDIITHEMTHAILDGLNRYYNRPTNPDALAFHEAFADIIALFQHFTFPDLLKHQIARTRGQLDRQNMLGQLAQQFGTAIGQYGSLRDALGKTNDQGEWVPAVPDPQAYLTVKEPHKRGSILVAAVFEAFLSIYKRRVADLLRIASGGTGVLAAGELHPDLVNRLADEAAKTAKHTLTMCIRAIDYCPPVDLTFGDYLRAIITADSEMVTSDTQHYRLAFIDAFRRRGIYPEGIKTLSEESLRFMRQDRFAGHSAQQQSTTMGRLLDFLTDYLKTYRDQIIFETDRQEIFNIGQYYVEDQPKREFYRYMGLYQPPKTAKKSSYNLPSDDQTTIDFENLTGMAFRDVNDYSYEGIFKGKKVVCQNKQPVYFKIVNLRLVTHQRADGHHINHIIFNLVQDLELTIEDEESETAGHFGFLAGCTLIFDLNQTKLKYVITKPLLLPRQPGDRLTFNKGLIQQQRRYQRDELGLLFSESQRYFYPSSQMAGNEPFALLHLQ